MSWIGEKPANKKLTHEKVRYTHPSNRMGQHCGNCSMFIDTAPARCTDVESPIYRNGWCKIWKAK